MGIEGLEEALAELHGMDARAADASPILAEIASGAASEMKQHLAAGLSQGTAMKPLSPGYAERKRKRFPGKSILRATDQMLNSVVSSSGPDFAEAGPTDPKAAYHSSPEPRAKMPLRDPFYVEDESVDAAEEALADYVGPRP